ncbi:hypothetical protein C0Q70_08781 [Pomacea canaliculata]|uniref:Poly [ADP-ribose] polymerase n=1 Tax=Pomacea canaliculata TaxID=400727 RepID=A0A2T7P7X8_POMCA|nr:hypothetical protein C0Q70_08781 [Pomacea canaliculata]
MISILQEADRESPVHDSIMNAFQSIFRYFRGYWSQGTPQDEKEQLEDETFYDAPEDALEDESDEETQLQKIQEVKYQEWLSRLETGPFYPHKLFFRNVSPDVSKELLMNFLEIVTGQEDIETLYCDRPGDVLVTFRTKVDFLKVKNKCQRKLLNKRQLEVLRVPVSNSILVENLSPDTNPDHVSCYFETPRAKGGTVLEVQPVQDKQKCVVCFKDANLVDEVLKVPHRLGGRELRVSLHNSDMLQMFNLHLSEVHANATVVGNVLIVSCTLTASMNRVDLLVKKWRDNVNKQLEHCFGFIRLQRLEVQPEIWWNVRKAVRESNVNTDDLVLSHDEEYTFSVLDRSFDEGDTFSHIQNIASVKQIEFESEKTKVSEAKKLKKFQLDLLMLSPFFSDTQSHHKDLKVDIKLGEREVVFHGPLMVIREAEVKMYEILQSASSRVVTDVPHVHVSLLATYEARDAVNNRLRQALLAATWECCGNAIIIYCLQQTALLQAVNLIKSSFESEFISLDEVSSSLQTKAEWKDNVEKLVRKHRGLVSINTHHRTISLTAFCDLMPTVKENIRTFFSESSIYSAAFQLSPSRLKFMTLFWEEKLSSIAEKLKQYKIKITLQSDRVLVGGTKQGIELVRKELTFLSEQIVCTEELITRKETIMCLSTPRNNNELQAIAFTCKCVLSLHPENSNVEMITTNLPVEGPRVHAVQGDITQLTVDVIVNAANELMDHAGGLARHIVYKAPQISTQGAKDLDFGGIRVTIKQGDITTEQVDAIVNSSNPTLDLNRGAVSRALKAKCGQALENECKAKILMPVPEIAQRKVVTTAAFNLRCKYIVHIDTSHYVNNDRLTTAYLNILREADNLGLNSIALPAIGTGNLNMSPSRSARAMGKALATHSRIRRTVRTVTVVLFDASMMEEVTVKLTKLAMLQVLIPSTSSRGQGPFKRLYLPQNGEIQEGGMRTKNNPLPEVLKLYIFASQYKRTDFFKALDGLVKNKFVEQEIKDFDKVPLEKRQELCRKYDLEMCQGNTGVRVKGMADDIQMLREEIINITSRAERQRQECMIANLVQWYFFEVTATGTKRIPYEKRENLLIENAYQKYQDTVELTDSEGTVYVVSFKDMTDSVKMCPADSVQITRKEIIADLANSESLLPETWEPLNSEESVKRVPLVRGCPEYNSVMVNVSLTAGRYLNIKSIERIQNPELYKQYLAKKTQMDKQNNGLQSEKTLWHGTSSDAIDNINLYGFNRSFCGKNATYYGQGVYFAVNSSYSMSDTYSVRDQSGRKHLYQCRVLVGCPTVGNSNMKFLPTRQGQIRYDSATDNNSPPKMYIVFNDTQAYPEYLITFE